MTLSGDCTTATIPLHHAAVLDRLARSEALSFDLAAVTAADVSLVQLLVAARRAGERRDLPFAVVAASDVVLAAFAAAGVPWSAFAAAAGEA